MRLAWIFILAVFQAQPGLADWVEGTGERTFDRETPEAEACRAAESRAREAAIRSRLGERVSAEDLMVCEEAGTSAECGLHRSVWSLIDGDIKGVRNGRTETVETGVPGFRRCIARLEVNVVPTPGRTDPGFDLGVELSASVFRSGDGLTVALTPSAPMFVALFQWLPYEQGEKQVSRLFPNPLDPDPRFRHAGHVPTREGSKRYALKVVFPETAPGSAKIVDEYLLAVGTASPVDFRDHYSLDDFRSRLLEIPRSGMRLVKRAYGVVRPR